MYGKFNITDNPAIHTPLDELGINISSMLTNSFWRQATDWELAHIEYKKQIISPVPVANALSVFSPQAG